MTAIQVETYETQELEAQLPGEEEEASRLIEELGLAGQTSVGHLPFRPITQEELDVFSVICPNKTKVTEFALERIPLRVLQVLKRAKSEGSFFCDFEIWSPNPGIKDPVLIGIHHPPHVPPKETWRRVTYILARWGEELESLSDLTLKATKIATDRARTSLLDAKVKIDATLTNLSHLPLNRLAAISAWVSGA